MDSNDKPAKKPFYKTWWGILFLLPISLSILIWKSEKFGKNTKIGLIAGLWIIFILIGSSDSQNSSSSSISDGFQDAKQTVEKNESEMESAEPKNVVVEKTESPVSNDTVQDTLPEEKEEKVAPAPTITVSQKNALRKAKDYLAYTAFSRDGLVSQLEYEQFSHEDAVYGADNSGADWFEQAAKKAEDYMDYSAFSRGSLIDQLVYEGFTQAQAEYGADAVGL